MDTKVDFAIDPNDKSMKALYRIARLAENHCYFHGRQIHGEKFDAVIAVLNNLIKTDYAKYQAIRSAAQNYHKPTKYDNGKWMDKEKDDLAFARKFANKYQKVAGVKGIKIYPDITLKS